MSHVAGQRKQELRLAPSVLCHNRRERPSFDIEVDVLVRRSHRRLLREPPRGDERLTYLGKHYLCHVSPLTFSLEEPILNDKNGQTYPTV